MDNDAVGSAGCVPPLGDPAQLVCVPGGPAIAPTPADSGMVADFVRTLEHLRYVDDVVPLRQIAEQQIQLAAEYARRGRASPSWDDLSEAAKAASIKQVRTVLMAAIASGWCVVPADRPTDGTEPSDVFAGRLGPVWTCRWCETKNRQSRGSCRNCWHPRHEQPPATNAATDPSAVGRKAGKPAT